MFCHVCKWFKVGNEPLSTDLGKIQAERKVCNWCGERILTDRNNVIRNAQIRVGAYKKLPTGNPFVDAWERLRGVQR